MSEFFDLFGICPIAIGLIFVSRMIVGWRFYHAINCILNLSSNVTLKVFHYLFATVRDLKESHKNDIILWINPNTGSVQPGVTKALQKMKQPDKVVSRSIILLRLIKT